MIKKEFEQISKEDIESLVDAMVPEGRTIEYKQAVYGSTPSDKKEFLKDICAFANGGGGDLLLGIEERKENGKNTGMPECVSGLNGVTADAEIRRMESMIRTGIEPSVQVKCKAVNGFTQGPVIIVRVYRSWASPHMVVADGDDRFYMRNSAGKHPMSVTEIRNSFNLHGTLIERLRKFRAERIELIQSNNFPMKMMGGAKAVLSIIPLGAFDGTIQVQIANWAGNPDLKPMDADNWGGWGPWFNLDGFMMRCGDGKGEVTGSYVQVFRTGAIESVWGMTFQDKEGRILIPSVPFESEIIVSTARLLRFLSSIEIQPPLVLQLSLVNVLGCSVFPARQTFFVSGHSIDRDLVVLPEVYLEDFTLDSESILKASFDALWQASGYERSFNYDESGKRIEGS